MNLEGIILSKLEKDRYFHLYAESKENKWTVNKTKTDLQKQKTNLWLPKGREMGGGVK